LKWEFPGGKVEAGETAHNALRREIREELSIDTAIGECLGTYFTPSDGYLIRLQCYWCSVASREVNLSSHVKSGWFSEDELMRLDWALPDVPAVEAIVQRDLSRP
jgi:8-oxo-dGTP diphosphatase